MGRRSSAGRSCSLLYVAFFVSMTCLGPPTLAQSDDWPQWGGPNRDFKIAAKGLAASWPDEGPRRLWSRELGEGYSSIAAVSGTLYTMYRRGNEEVVIALEAATGKTVWEHAYAAPFIVVGREADIVQEYHLSNGLGPHSTPLIVGDHLFAAGATGWFHCLDKNTGEVIWKHHLFTDLGGFVRQRGYAPSPIAYQDTVILPVGAVGGSIMAFDQQNGEIVWRRHDYHHAYASPSLIDVDGQEQLVTFMRDWVVAVDPRNGDLFWSYPIESTQGTNVSTPVFGPGNLLFMSASYGVGARVLRLTRVSGRTDLEEVWVSPRVRLHYANAIRIGDVIYGSSGDFGPAFFTAIDVHTGSVFWQDRRLARANFIYADGHFIMVDEDGTLVLATPSAKGLVIDSQTDLLESNAWTVPTLIGTTLYVRDRKSILALDLGPQSPPSP